MRYGLYLFSTYKNLENQKPSDNSGLKLLEDNSEVADVEIAAVVVIADLTNEEAREKGLGPALLAEKYGTKVYSIITDKDVEKALNH